MINFNSPPQSQKISEIKQTIQIGDKVRCYKEDIDDLQFFVGYAYVTEIMDINTNYHWCKASLDDFENWVPINYAYYVIKI